MRAFSATSRLSRQHERVKEDGVDAIHTDGNIPRYQILHRHLTVCLSRHLMKMQRERNLKIAVTGYALKSRAYRRTHSYVHAREAQPQLETVGTAK